VETPTDTPRRLLTAAEVAELLGLSVRQVRRLTPELGGFNLGRRAVRFDPDRVQRWIDERKAEAERGTPAAA